MKKLVSCCLVVFMFLALVGCGGGDRSNNVPLQFNTQILSNSALDGDIAFDGLTGLFTVTQGGTQSVFAGVDPDTGVEYRAFLNFPLTGSVPGNAIISSAFLDIFINSIQPQPLSGSLPIRIDLVSFQPPTLIGTDFNRTLQPALATTTIIPPIAQSDFGRHVFVDVTSLMNEALRLGLVNLQLRILRDSSSFGLIEINDTTGVNRGTLAPLLDVTYF